MGKKGSEIGSNKRAKAEDKGEGFLGRNMMSKKITKSQAESFKSGHFKYFDVFTIVPFFKSLGKRYPFIN